VAEGPRVKTDIDPLDLVDPDRYARDGYPHDVWTRLRADAPVAFVAPPGFEPFWAITKHADIQQIASQPARFSSAQGITLRRAGAPMIPPSDILVMLDPPQHAPMRRVANPRFTPRAVRSLRDDIERIAAEILDAAAPRGASGELDFVETIAAPFPLAVITSVLGVPRNDWRLLFQWTNEIIGKNDSEYRRPGETPGQTIKRARGEVRAYFERLIALRRRDPQDDLMSELVAGEIHGAPLTDEQLVSYCELLVEAGNETTRNAISGGLLAFCEHREQWERLRAHPELLSDATEEILRWVSPISHFTRTAIEDCEVRGTTIRTGEQVALYFASANRDEDVFDDPFAFRVDRRPNPHLAFGFGEHFCMGAHTARVEIEAMFDQLLARLQSFELAGPVERLSSAVNGSIKHLPLRFRMSERSA
jgi:cytochrome P450